MKAASVAEVVRRLEEMAPGFTFYFCHEHGRLRTHVNIFVDEECVANRSRLSDGVAPESEVLIVQTLNRG